MNEIKFPLDFSKCPACGSERRIAHEIIRGEKEKGKIDLDAKGFLFNHQTTIGNPGIQLTVPVVITFYDACADCGTVYCIHADVGTGMTKPNPKQGPQRPPAGGMFSPS